jgi:hypothetical protein
MYIACSLSVSLLFFSFVFVCSWADRCSRLCACPQQTHVVLLFVAGVQEREEEEEEVTPTALQLSRSLSLSMLPASLSPLLLSVLSLSACLFAKQQTTQQKKSRFYQTPAKPSQLFFHEPLPLPLPLPCFQPANKRNERMNERTNQQTNKQTSKQANARRKVFLVVLFP